MLKVLVLVVQDHIAVLFHLFFVVVLSSGFLKKINFLDSHTYYFIDTINFDREWQDDRPSWPC